MAAFSFGIYMKGFGAKKLAYIGSIDITFLDLVYE